MISEYIRPARGGPRHLPQEFLKSRCSEKQYQVNTIFIIKRPTHEILSLTQNYEYVQWKSDIHPGFTIFSKTFHMSVCSRLDNLFTVYKDTQKIPFVHANLSNVQGVLL